MDSIVIAVMAIVTATAAATEAIAVGRKGEDLITSNVGTTEGTSAEGVATTSIAMTVETD